MSRRCLALRLAVLFGVLLPLFSRTWISLGVGLGGAALALVTYWRNCREKSAQSARDRSDAPS